MIRSLLIANRGEIAVRIIRTCKLLGIRTIAVYSQADAEALHVQLADEAVCIGPAPASKSYLHKENILQAACASGADAIHPGFGFLSENAEFARMCQACGLIFIGPHPQAIERMGIKTSARDTMEEAGVPCIPGSQRLGSLEEARQEARRIGYPLLLKACSGGGGKGIRLLESESELEQGYETACREALASFGDAGLFLEKYLSGCKHVEVQIAADRYGHIEHLFERDCSFQWRRQKMLEEAPCALLDAPTRNALYEAAVKAARAVGYDSLGTVEFLLDGKGRFYFLEMNTRIQVEHPVTEMVTGLDLIAMQIEIAEGKPLEIQTREPLGHALEVRLNAQDAAREFAGTAGTIDYLNLPGGAGVRVDAGITQGTAVLPFYDSMLAKIIVHGKDRAECLVRMKSALEEVIVEGIPVNDEFLYRVLDEPEFRAGTYDIQFAATAYERWKENA